MSLKEKLEAIGKQSGGKLPRETREKMHRANEELKNSGIVEKALNVGDKMPAFSLPNTSGETINSADLLAKGNLVLTFFRGVW